MRTLLPLLRRQLSDARHGDRSWIAGSCVGALLVAGLTIPKWAFIESIGAPTPFLLYFAAIMGAAYRGGVLAGIVTTLMSAWVAWWGFMDPGHTGFHLRNFATFTAFFVEGLCISLVTGGFVVQRKTAKQAIQDAESAKIQRDLVLSGVDEGIALQDARGRILYANQLAAENAGCSSPEELMALPPQELMGRMKFQSLEGQPLPLEQLPGRRILMGESAPEITVRFRKGGDEKDHWGVLRSNALRDEEGRVQYVVNLLRDVTEAHEQEADLKLAREWFQIALRSIGDAVIATDSQGYVNLLNPVAEDLTGWKMDDALGRPLEDVFNIIQEGTRKPADSPVRQVLQTGKVVGLANHTLLLRPDGSEIAIDDSASPIRGWDNRVEGVILVFRDVSAKRADEERASFLARATEELNSSLNYHTTLATVARLAVPGIADWCAVDILQDGEVVRLAVAHVDEKKVEHVRELERRYPSDPDAPSGVHHILRTGQPEIIEEIPVELLESQAKDEEHKRQILELGLGSYIGVPLKRAGKPFGVITLVMAESKRLYSKKDFALATALADRASLAVENAQLYQDSMAARELAEAANRTKDEFLAMLGHELRNPLAPIRSALELMSMRPNETHDHEVSIIRRQTEHLVRLVDDLLDVARITHGRIELNRSYVSVSEIIDRAREIAWPHSVEQSHQLHIDIAPNFNIECDFVRLSQAIANLLNNAIKYTPLGGNIWITARCDANSAMIAVRDDGIGIGAETLSLVFQRFVQAPQALDRAQGGLGLGLAIVQGLVSAHGGSVTAHSAGIGKGAKFVVQLPLGQPPLEQAKQPALSQPPLPQRILIVDDNQDACELLASLLEIEGHQVSTAHDGPSALSVAEKTLPEVALLDVGLPGMTGYELGRKLRTLPGMSDIRLIAITGYGRAQDRDRSLGEKFKAHLVKPIDLNSLREALRS